MSKIRIPTRSRPRAASARLLGPIGTIALAATLAPAAATVRGVQDDSIATRHDAREAVRRDFELAELLDRLLPPAMTAERMRADAIALRLEPDDFETWETLVEAYRTEHDETGGFGADAARRLVAVVWRFEDGELRPLPVPEYEELRRLVRRANDRLRARDRSMLDALERMAPGETARDARGTTYRRRVELNWRDLAPLAARVDLLELLDALELDEENSILVGEIVASHRRAFPEAGDRRHEASLDLADLEASILVELGPSWRRAADPSDVAASEERLADARAEVLRASGEMARINVETLRELRRRLPPDPAARLARAWYERVRPELFADQRAVERLLATAARTTTLDEDERETLATIPRLMLERTIPEDAKRVDLDAEIVRLRDAERDARETVALETRLRIEAERARVDVARRAILRRAIDELLGMLGSQAQETTVIEDAATLRDRLRTLDDVDRRHAEILDDQADAIADRRWAEQRAAELFDARDETFDAAPGETNGPDDGSRR